MKGINFWKELETWDGMVDKGRQNKWQDAHRIVFDMLYTEFPGEKGQREDTSPALWLHHCVWEIWAFRLMLSILEGLFFLPWSHCRRFTASLGLGQVSLRQVSNTTALKRINKLHRHLLLCTSGNPLVRRRRWRITGKPLRKFRRETEGLYMERARRGTMHKNRRAGRTISSKAQRQ